MSVTRNHDSDRWRVYLLRIGVWEGTARTGAGAVRRTDLLAGRSYYEI